MNSDRIEKQITLAAPVSRVWRALTDHREFGEWFGARMETPFAPGRQSRGQITYPGYEHLAMIIAVTRMEVERTFAFQWHPYAVDADVDYSHEPMTTVECTLEQSGEGTLLHVVESGFNAIPAERRALAFKMNDNGWVQQMANIEKYVQAKP